MNIPNWLTSRNTLVAPTAVVLPFGRGGGLVCKQEIAIGCFIDNQEIYSTRKLSPGFGKVKDGD